MHAILNNIVVCRFLDTAQAFDREAGPSLGKFEVCDNVDLPTILQVSEYPWDQDEPLALSIASSELNGTLRASNSNLETIKCVCVQKLKGCIWHYNCIVQEYEAYYYVKLKKNPKITKRSSGSGETIKVYVLTYLWCPSYSN